MNTKMKVLSLALVGLCGYAGSAMATCPTGPTAWTSNNVSSDASLAITTPGFASTECKMSISLNSGALANARALVVDDSPNNENRYRASFYISTNALTGLTLANQQTKIFNASADTGPAGVSTQEISMTLLGSGSGPAIRMLVADASQASKFRTITAVLPASASKTYVVEIDMAQGDGSAANNFRYWVTAVETAAPGDANPTGQATVTNNGWSGVTSVNLGVFSTTAGYRTAVATQAVAFDQFDSRRQTYIGY